MIVVSSGQLAQTTSKPITIAVPGQGGAAVAKTMTLAAGAKVAATSTGGGQQLITSSSGQILAVQPAQNIASATQVAGQKLGLTDLNYCASTY